MQHLSEPQASQIVMVLQVAMSSDRRILRGGFRVQRTAQNPGIKSFKCPDHDQQEKILGFYALFYFEITRRVQ